MDSIFGIVGDGFVFMGADTSANQSIIRMKVGEDKIKQMGTHRLLATMGDGGDRTQFGDMIEANIKLYEFRNGLPLSTHAAANYIRGEMATALRKGPYQVNMLVGGFDKGKPSLYWMDHLAALHQQNCAAHGYGGIFMYSLFDTHWKPGMSLDEVKELARKCVKEVKARLVTAPPEFLFKVIDKDGVRIVEL
jgi:20S proteasome subunit beta 4